MAPLNRASVDIWHYQVLFIIYQRTRWKRYS
jgi:hypothetical protein